MPMTNAKGVLYVDVEFAILGKKVNMSDIQNLQRLLLLMQAKTWVKKLIPVFRDTFKELSRSVR